MRMFSFYHQTQNKMDIKCMQYKRKWVTIQYTHCNRKLCILCWHGVAVVTQLFKLSSSDFIPFFFPIFPLFLIHTNENFYILQMLHEELKFISPFLSAEYDQSILWIFFPPVFRLVLLNLCTVLHSCFLFRMAIRTSSTSFCLSFSAFIILYVKLVYKMRTSRFIEIIMLLGNENTETKMYSCIQQNERRNLVSRSKLCSNLSSYVLGHQV